MHPLYSELIKYLEAEDKALALDLIISKLEHQELDIVTLYNELLRPALNDMHCDGPEEYCIWKEHIRSSIIRAIIENCHSFIIKERDEKYRSTSAKVRKRAATGNKVMVLCPTEELHELGPRMIADFFTLCGYDVTFVGANTPKTSFVSAINIIKPQFIAISVTNYYNLVATQKVIAEIRNLRHQDFKIIVGGHAFSRNPKAYKDIGADLMLQTFDDIRALSESGSSSVSGGA